MNMFHLKTHGGGYKVLALLTLAAGLSAASVSCSKQGSSVEQDLVRSDRVIFGAGGPAFSAAVGTKASSGITEVTALENFYASAVTGSAGSQVSVWNSITFASDGKTPATYSGDKWWPITDPSYIFYASNLPLNFAAAGTTVSASAASSADKDAVCAYMPNPAYKVKNTLSFEHIFARIGKVTVSAGPDYSISAVSISLTPKVSGTYDLAAGAGKSDGTGWSALVDGSATVLASPASIATGGHVDTANDVYLVPGKYTISATWTATRGNYTETFTGMTQEIDIVGGKVNNISTTLVGKATEVEFGVEISPWGSNEVEVDFFAQNEVNLETPLTFEAMEPTVIKIYSYEDKEPKTIEVSTDDGATWTEFTSSSSGTQIASLGVGENALVRGNNAAYAHYDNDIEPGRVISDCTFISSGKVYCYGNIMSLVKKTGYENELAVAEYAFAYLFSDFDGSYDSSQILSHPEKRLFLPATTLANSCYRSMFSRCTGLTEAPALPATTLTPECYSSMFRGCTSLIEAPALPATTLANYCYSSMFKGCTGLTEAPALPATTLTPDCYNSMFSGCTSLTEAPALPATTLAQNCYYSMFEGCTSLTEAPALPATTLANYCYSFMFYGCTSLTEAPELPATTLVNSCYSSMFRGCSNLSYIKALFLIRPTTSCTMSWVQNVKSTGTFVKNASATWNVKGDDGIPSGWTVVTE